MVHILLFKAYLKKPLFTANILPASVSFINDLKKKSFKGILSKLKAYENIACNHIFTYILFKASDFFFE